MILCQLDFSVGQVLTRSRLKIFDILDWRHRSDAQTVTIDYTDKIMCLSITLIISDVIR